MRSLLAFTALTVAVLTACAPEPNGTVAAPTTAPPTTVEAPGPGGQRIVLRGTTEVDVRPGDVVVLFDGSELVVEALVDARCPGYEDAVCDDPGYVEVAVRIGAERGRLQLPSPTGRSGEWALVGPWEVTFLGHSRDGATATLGLNPGWSES